MEHETLETRLRAGALDAQLTRLYGAEGLEAARSWGATTRTTSTAGSWPPVWTWTSWPPSPPTRAA